MKTKRNLLPALALAAAFLHSPIVALAAPQTYDFKDPKGVNNATFSLDAPLEAINGNANGITGKVTFDPANPAATKGWIAVEAKSLHVPNPMMKNHLHGPQWMDVERYPELRFTADRLKNVRQDGATVKADAWGRLKLHGKERQVTIPVTLTHLPDRLGARTNGRMEGDLLVIRAKFEIKRSDYDINPKAPAEKVADTIELKLAIAGAAPR